MRFEDIPTPSYVLDEKKLKQNLEILKEVREKSGAKILLAQKAYSAYQTYPLIAQYLDGTTASGIYEARLAHEEFKVPTTDRLVHDEIRKTLDVNASKPENHVFEPAFKEDELRDLCKMCDHIVFNSLSQLEYHRPTWEKAVSEGKVSVGIRINPEISTEDSHEIYDPCAPGSRLGVRNDDMPEALPKGVEGLHVHNLCEQGFEPLEDTFLKVEREFARFFPSPLIPDDYDTFIFKEFERNMRIRDREEYNANYGDNADNTEPAAPAPDENIGKIKWINLGGGHHITRSDYDIDALIGLVSYIRAKYGIDVYLEPGEAIALNAGYLVTTVLDVVETDRMPVLILDTSAACHMPDVLEMPYRPPLRDSEEPGEMNYTYRLSSRTCLAGDIIGDYSFNDEKKPGDRLVFEDMAIYSFVKNNTFNGMALPSISLMHEDGEVEILRSFNYYDFKTRL
ncbi:carboxynorspermidine decarboxylase [Butyrivibrio sp. NC2007]|uniref:carboxynorspermidine decarboxylase n=1 Tax=Butyrivibrio sp. NC2007 TaxID=1280683 RepID=UPI0003B3863F|nr:carboxynorspermidine decarboxylase [Butyrivibrio sp. NC2007]